MKRLLIVYHTQFGATAQMAEAARDGASRSTTSIPCSCAPPMRGRSSSG
jgi:flavodoxin